MKKIACSLTLGLCLASGVSSASHVYDLEVGLTNTGSGACILKKALNLCGAPRNGQHVPEILPADGSMQTVVYNGMHCGRNGADLIVEYTCDENKTLQLEFKAGLDHPNGWGYGWVEWNVLHKTQDVFVVETAFSRPHRWGGPNGKTKQHGGMIHLNIAH